MIKKILLIVFGFISLALGAVGIVMPLVPTTPLVILAAACFGASCKKIDIWLQRSRLFGPFIDNYRTGRGISRLHKYSSIAFLWVGLITSMIVTRTGWIFVVLCLVGMGVTVHLLMIKTRRSM